MHRAGILIVAVVWFHDASPAMAWEEKASPQGSIPFQTIHTDGKQLLVANIVPIPGKTKTVTYTVKVPIQTPNGVRFVEQQRARVEQETKEERIPVSGDYQFATVDGKKIDREKLISEIPDFGMQVITVYDKEPLPKEWVQLLRNTAVVMRCDPVPVNDEQ